MRRPTASCPPHAVPSRLRLHWERWGNARSSLSPYLRQVRPRHVPPHGQRRRLRTQDVQDGARVGGQGVEGQADRVGRAGNRNCDCRRAQGGGEGAAGGRVGVNRGDADHECEWLRGTQVRLFTCGGRRPRDEKKSRNDKQKPASLRSTTPLNLFSPPPRPGLHQLHPGRRQARCVRPCVATASAGSLGRQRRRHPTTAPTPTSTLPPTPRPGHQAGAQQGRPQQHRRRVRRKCLPRCRRLGERRRPPGRAAGQQHPGGPVQACRDAAGPDQGGQLVLQRAVVL